MSALLDLTGRRVHRLTVLHRDTTRAGTYWVCRCDCGGAPSVRRDHLTEGRVQSCGCQLTDRYGSRTFRHGSREWLAWRNAKGRCYNPRNNRYATYGARGIRMDERWRQSFAAFLADIGPCPPGHSLNRIDNDGPYASWNCDWATPRQQAGNMARNFWIDYQGHRAILQDWARRVGIDRTTLSDRLKRGWTVERALTQPPRVY